MNTFQSETLTYWRGSVRRWNIFLTTLVLVYFGLLTLGIVARVPMWLAIPTSTIWYVCMTIAVWRDRAFAIECLTNIIREITS